jgi:hypothetical protein
MVDQAQQVSRAEDAEQSEETLEQRLRDVTEDVEGERLPVGEDVDVDGEGGLRTVDRGEGDVVEVSVAVDTSEMSAEKTEVLAVLADQFEESFHEIYEKNRDYDWSFLASGSKLAASSGTPFEHPARAQAFGLLTRSGDKRERLVENVFGDGEAAVSDEPAVTALEAANYYQFLAFVLSNPELAASFGTSETSCSRREPDSPATSFGSVDNQS